MVNNIWNRNDVDLNLATLRDLRKGDGMSIAAGRAPGSSVVHKFGHNSAVGATFEPIAFGGVYQMLQPAAATTLRVKAGNAADTAAGAGAREITLIGLDETGAEVTEEVATAGASASAVTSATFIRLYRAYVSASGVYATAVVGSHTASVVIENGAGGTDWATIDATGFSHGQTEIGFYAVPLGKVAYVKNIFIQADANQPVDVIFYQRRNILEAAAPYTPLRMLFQFDAVEREELLTPFAPMGPFPALTDLGAIAKTAAGGGDVSIDFEIILEDA